MNSLKNKFLPLLKFFIGWPLSLVAIAFLLKIVFSNYFSVISSVKTINIWLLLISILGFIIYFILRSILWQKIIKLKNIDISFKETAYYFGFSELKRYIPGNIWAFASRTYHFSERGLDKRNVLRAILIEAELIIISSLALSIPAVELLFKNNLITYFFYFLFFLTLLIFIFNAKIFSLFLRNKILTKMSFLFSGFSPLSNLELFATSFAAFLVFGIATYFAMVSIIEINIFYVVQYVSIFVFSLLVGYLSLITPMGLGVREGVISYGLSKFILFPLAGIVAIFSRILFVVSEILFLAFIFIWNKTKYKLVITLENFINSHKYEIVLLLAMIAYASYFTFASFLRYDNFFTGRFDLGNMDQAVWNTIHGRIFQITDPNGTAIISRLAFHADFILILISPLYLIWSHPKMLLLLQSVTLSLGAIFVYLISKHVLKNKNISLTFALVFLLNPSLQYSNLYDFHPVVLSTSFLLAASYFLIKKAYPLFILFAFLSALCKEEVWAIVAVFGLILTIRSIIHFLKNKSYPKIKLAFELLIGLSVFTVSLGIFYYLIWYLIPATRGGNHFALSYYSDFGFSPTSIIKNILFSPLKTMQIIFSKNQLYYLFQLFLPVGFLSFASPLALIFALPDLAINLLSNNSQLHEIYFQYTATITPFIFISAIYGVKRLIKLFPKLNLSTYCYFLILTTLLSMTLFGPLPGTKKPSVEMFNTVSQEEKIIDGFLSAVPSRYSIAATNNIGSHLSRRQRIYTVPIGIDKADIVMFLLNDQYAQPSLKAQIEMANKMRNNKNYIQIFKLGDFIVFEKRDLYLQVKPKHSQIDLFPFSIPSLQNRDYSESKIEIEKKVSSTKLFNSYIVSYLSDGLKNYALMNIPNSPMPKGGFPVIIVNHGYINPKTYDTVNSYKQITDYFSSNGYLVLKPDFRGNGKSEIENKPLMRFAYPIDVINLITSVGTVREANQNNIYLWGHSMGGEVTLKVLEIIGKKPEVSQKVKGAALWAPVTDPLKWFNHAHIPTLEEAKTNKYPYIDTFKIMGTPEDNPELWKSVSQLSYLADVNTPIQISHGTADTTVPYQWSVELYDDLISLEKNAKFLIYQNNGHNLTESWTKAAKNTLDFFKQGI